MPRPGCPLRSVRPQSHPCPSAGACALLLGAALWLPAQAAEPAAHAVTAVDAATAPGPESAEPGRAGWLSNFRDAEDGKFDASDWLLERRGALPVPILVTEPAIGYGGGVALLFFQRGKGPPTRTTARGDVRPIAPDIHGAFAFRTENGTNGAGAFASLHFDQDRWRYKGGIARPQIYLDYYTQAALGTPRRIGYQLEGVGSLQQVQRRVGDGDLYLALRWVYLDFDAQLDVESDYAAFDPREFAQRSSGLGLGVEYDVRDNVFTPSQGWIAALEATAYDQAFGSDVDYETARGKAFAYWPLLDDRLVLGARADARWAQGDVPFYAQPFVELRGIPAARYQDRRTLVLEAEARYNLTPRWALVGFIGAGRAWGRRDDFDEVGTAVAKGVGLRYQIARKLGLYTGLDYAWGPEESTVYVQVGSAWR